MNSSEPAIQQLPTGVHFNVARAVYDAQDAINHSAIKSFLRAATPAHFRYEQDHPDEDRDYLRLGNAIDCLVSAPSEFRNLFVVAPETYPCEPTKKDPRTEKPWTMQSDWCKRWWSDALAAGTTPLTPAELQRVRGMVDGLERHADIPRILSTAHRQVCLIAAHPTFGYRMKAMLDALPDVHSEWIYDLKSFGQPATARNFCDQVWKLGYNLQAAFYLEMARLCAIPATKFGWPVVESNPPHESAVFWMEEGDDEIMQARKCYTEAMPRFMACVESGNWPGHSQDWIKVKFKPWQLSNDQPDYDRLV